MQTLNRAKLIVKAHVNDLLAKAEDTRKTRGLMIEEMRQNIRDVKSFIANAIADLKLMEREIDEQEAEAKKWEDRAVFALKKEEEDLARRALARKCEHVQRVTRYREQIATQRETIDSLKSSLKALETRLETARYSPPTLEVAKSVEPVRPVASSSPATEPILDTSAFDAYDRMIERVREFEAQAEALAELTQGDELEREFHELETRGDVEKDLAALKAKLGAENREGSSAME